MLTPTNTVVTTEETKPLEPHNFNNLILILDVYLSEEITTDKPYLVKDGMKIIL